jgi:hypothetical protein
MLLPSELLLHCLILSDHVHAILQLLLIREFATHELVSIHVLTSILCGCLLSNIRRSNSKEITDVDSWIVCLQNLRLGIVSVLHSRLSVCAFVEEPAALGLILLCIT